MTFVYLCTVSLNAEKGRLQIKLIIIIVIIIIIHGMEVI